MSETRFIKNGKIDESKFEKFEKIPVMIEAYQTDEEVEIETLEGVMKANKGDWIIKGVKGELYPCKPDVFDLTYTKVERMTENERFTVVMNEFDEVEYITDIVDCEDRDFADFIDFANKMAKENEQLKKENSNLKKALWEAEENYLYEAYSDNSIRRNDKLKSLKEDFKRRYWND